MHLLDGALLLPLALPPTVIGLVLLLIFGKQSPVGQLLADLGLRVVFSWPATVIAAFVVTFPLMYHIARSAFQQVDRDLVDTARIFGMSESRILWQVWIPLAWPGILTGVILSFVRALGEFGATLMIAGNIPGRTQTIPIAIFFQVEGGNFLAALGLAAVAMAISTFAIILLHRVSPRQ
jgi:molybdate transport system permease protein